MLLAHLRTLSALLTLLAQQSLQAQTTEAPYPQAPGKFILEVDSFGYFRNTGGDVKIRSRSHGGTIFRAGVRDDLDLQALFMPYVSETVVSPDGSRERSRGVSDVTLRANYQLWANADQTSALSIYPYLSIPTRSKTSSRYLQGGMLIPYDVPLGDDLSLSAQAGLGIVRNTEKDAYDAELTHSVMLYQEIADYFFYIEYTGINGTDRDFAYQASIGPGCFFDLTDDISFTIHSALGLNDAAGNLLVFSYIGYRF